MRRDKLDPGVMAGARGAATDAALAPVPERRDIAVRTTGEIVHRPGLFDMTPRNLVAHATEIANVLKDIIKQQGLSVKIGPNEYVKSEGWATLGVMLGILPRERDVTELPGGDFEAFVDLIRQQDGVIVGGASSICSVDEKRWKTAEKYARRSMAITRATGKAYRLCFSWIMTMAGYQPTPYEEMPHEEEQKPAKRTTVSHDPPSAPIYDPDNYKHSDALTVKLRERGIPEEKFNKIGMRLRGRLTTDINDVLAHIDDPDTTDDIAL